ncbi:hypothetical protein AB4Y43_01105 [Paraburkholderia sp. BR10872]|uniref:hypothetical protein n=1 Tax=Paraburkholderia sp. BR10872 TaxID=3236989 RepID=UPI0034D29DE5
MSTITDEQAEDIQEAREILVNMLRSVEEHGPYSAEATCTFLRQAILCLPRFSETFCSSCSKALGPGNSGASHCGDHK